MAHAKRGSKKTATKKTTAKKSAKKAARKKQPPLDLEKELSIESLMARGQALVAEREARAASEREVGRAVRAPVEVRPTTEVHWGYPYCLDERLPADERAALLAFFGRFTEVADKPSAGYFVVGPDTDPEARRAAWDGGGQVLELEQLRAQLPPDDFAGRSERLARVLARPTDRGWSELVMLLLTWDEATLPAAVAEAERLLADWPDELRVHVDRWAGRPELERLVRARWAVEGEPWSPAGASTLRTQLVEELAANQSRLAGIRSLEISGKPGIPGVVAGCTGLPMLERLILQQPTYSSGDGVSELARLLRAPHLQRLRGLSLYGYTLTDEDLAALADCPQPLEHLRIQCAHMRPKDAYALATLAARTRLRTLDLKYNELGPEGAGILFDRSGDWQALRVLDFSANEIGDEGAAAIARAAPAELRWLNLASNDPANQLTAAGARALADAPLGMLETLNVFGHPIGAEGVAALLYSRRLRGLRALNAAFPGASLAEIVERCGDGEPVAIEVLNLCHMNASKPRKLDLAGAEFLRSVRSLNVDGLDGAEYAAVLACPHLEACEVLVLGGGHSNRPRGFKALVTTEPPPRLRFVNMSGWELTAAEAAKLAGSPLGRQLWGVELMSSYTPPDAWYELYRAGLPVVGSVVFDSHAPSEYTTTTTFREEI